MLLFKLRTFMCFFGNEFLDRKEAIECLAWKFIFASIFVLKNVCLKKSPSTFGFKHLLLVNILERRRCLVFHFEFLVVDLSIDFPKYYRIWVSTKLRMQIICLRFPKIDNVYQGKYHIFEIEPLYLNIALLIFKQINHNCYFLSIWFGTAKKISAPSISKIKLFTYCTCHILRY